MDFRSSVRNELVQDASGVWTLAESQAFDYTEGAAAERYLHDVLLGASDLSSTSTELEKHAKDWSSEYHLTTKRAQLLAGLELPRSARVLEVGCGCGAITRHLGETFDNVVSVEGSLSRARLARLRTRDLPGVTILCGPFQDIRFTAPFDIIFCIGVYEYSGSFVSGDDPYDAVLKYFKSLLSPDGVLVVAIENQFGLKYWTSAREDHVARMFEGIEGYRSQLAAVRTFGRTELADNLQRHFGAVRFLYPYPDYKIPDCVLAEEFVASPAAGELIAQSKARDYGGDRTPLWDEALTTLELARNRALPFFANSFLVLASSTESALNVFPQLGVLYSAGRRVDRFRTITHLVRAADGGIVAVKRARHPGEGSGPLRLADSESRWASGLSLQTLVHTALRSKRATLERVFAPCRPWLEHLRRAATEREGGLFVAGEHIDSTWQNAYVSDEGCQLIDREWVLAREIRLEVLVIRAAYQFLFSATHGVDSAALLGNSGRAAIRAIATTLGIALTDRDFVEFIELESEFQSLAYGLERRRVAAVLRWFLANRTSLRMVTTARARIADGPPSERVARPATTPQRLAAAATDADAARARGRPRRGDRPRRRSRS
jgi:SAM-dependent methyltransferase